jgi:hypothetical protein
VEHSAAWLVVVLLQKHCHLLLVLVLRVLQQ